MNTSVLLLICGTIALHSCKGYDGAIPVDPEEEDEEESMSAEIVRQMYESVPWSALSNKSVREALHTLTEFVTSREARSLVRTFVLDIWSEREDEDDVDFLTTFLHFLGTVSPEPKVWQATHRILSFLQSSLQENFGTDMAQSPQEYDEDLVENIDNFLEQNDVFNKEEQHKDDYKEYADQVIERNGILKTYDIHKILQEKMVDQNLVVEDTPAANIIPTTWTDPSSSTQPAISTAENLLLNNSMNHGPEINKIDKSSDMEIIIKLKDKPLGQINVEVKHASEKNEERTPVTTQMNVHAKDKATKKYTLVTTPGNVRVKQAKDKRKVIPREEEDITSIPFPNLAKDQKKEEDMAVTPLPTCPLVTDMASPDITHKLQTSNQHNAEQLPCEAQELELQEWEKVAFLSLIRTLILKEKYKMCQNTSDKSTLQPSSREISGTQVTDSALINITLPNLQAEYSLDVIPNYASVSPLPDTQLTDKDGSNKSMPDVVTSIYPDPLKINNTQDLNTYMNFFSKLLHQISNDSVTPSHPEITTVGNDQPSTPPSETTSSEQASSSTSTTSVESETVLFTKVSESTPQVTNQLKDNVQKFTYVLKNLPIELLRNRGEDRGPQLSRTSSEKMNREDSPGPYVSNIEPVLIYRTSDPAKKQKPRQHHKK